MKFAIGIPCYNGAQRLDYLLESIFKFYTRAKAVDILVSDDCSPQAEETRKVCEKWGVRFTQPDEWKGVGGNTNHVIRSLDADVIAVIQDDILFSKGSMEVMEKFWEDNRWLRLGSVGWTYFQSWELRQVGIIPTVEAFYPPTWNTGEIRRNAYTFHAEQDPPIHPSPNVRPYLKGTPSGVAFAISRLAWEDCAGMYEFGMFEGGMFHDMWDRGWVNLIIPTPPMLHGHRLGATFHMDQTLRERIEEHPEKGLGRHAFGEQLYERLRGRRYLEDVDYVMRRYTGPEPDRTTDPQAYQAGQRCRDEIMALIKYDFNPMEF